ncbi:ATP-dependent DNA helicase [Candidatus Woesearchaeota archaeon]|nr:ATP-dependent DNA helicase [Candidatus Woesearchaeota archaeon]
MQTNLFPYDSVRREQDKLIAAVFRMLKAKGQLVVHAPTGLGKTAATLAPTIEHALAENKRVIFMTSRLTQHRLALDTITQIRQKHNVDIKVVNIIGKKHMCLQPGVQGLSGKEFAEYCKAMREDDVCEHYTRLRTGEDISPTASSALVQLGKNSPNTPEQVKMFCAQEEYKLCPYEMSMLQAKDANVILCDYSYIFNSNIREGFLSRIGSNLGNCILIVDEGHNLPERVKSLASERMTSISIKRAVKELDKHEDAHLHHVKELGEMIERWAEKTDDERYVTRSEFLQAMDNIIPIDELILDLQEVAKLVREEQRSSSCGAIADFLGAWQQDMEGFTRILHVERDNERQGTFMGTNTELFWALSYRCLDPSVVARDVLEEAHSAVIMSGTLTPVEMYAEIIGANQPELLTLESPFPHKNRMNLVIPKTTTQYKRRSPEMYREIAEICAKLSDTIPGNLAIFFPSYVLMGEVADSFQTLTEKTVFREHSKLSKEEREDLLDRFRKYQNSGAVLLGVMGGSFSEGVDLPGHELRAVVIVGLPLGRPDLETKALIDYYGDKFGKGWEYGYTYPAFNKTLQSAGRCIRTESDRGVIVFLDERYAWENYHRCFPRDWDIRLTLLYQDLIRDFFSEPPEPGSERGED